MERAVSYRRQLIPERPEQSVINGVDSNIPVRQADCPGHWHTGFGTWSSVAPHGDVFIFAEPYDVTDRLQDGCAISPAQPIFRHVTEGRLRRKGIAVETAVCDHLLKNKRPRQEQMIPVSSAHID